MAKLKATPKNFAEALEVLGNRSSIRLGNNTYLESFTDGTQTDLIAVRLHSTKERLNQFIDGKVYQQKYAWFYVAPAAVTVPGIPCSLDWGNPVAFEDGMNIGREL